MESPASRPRSTVAALFRTLASASPSPPPRPHPRSPPPPSLSPSAVAARRYPTMAAPIQIVSSRQDIAHVLANLQIDAIDRADEVQFELGEQTSLSEAVHVKARTEPGRDGFVLVNHELLACKFRTKMKLDEEFKRMVDASLRRINEELGPIEDSIAVLRVLVRTADPQMPANNGPPLAERGQGPQQCIYPHPPFPDKFSFEHNDANHRVPYKHPHATQELRDEAAARDRRGQRALWEVKLRVLEVRQSILKERKTEMMLRMKEEYDRMMDEPSDLGVGYADFAFPPLA